MLCCFNYWRDPARTWSGWKPGLEKGPPESLKLSPQKHAEWIMVEAREYLDQDKTNLEKSLPPNLTL